MKHPTQPDNQCEPLPAINLKVAWLASAILWSITQIITWIEGLFWFVDSSQHMLANRSHVRYEFTNSKKLVRIEASSICRQQFGNVCRLFCAVHTHQLEFTNFSFQCESRFRSFFDHMSPFKLSQIDSSAGRPGKFCRISFVCSQKLPLCK